MVTTPDASRVDPCCTIVDDRQYTCQPGQRDTLSELFDREFVETQEKVGIHQVGQFRDLDRPDYFVWMRGFTDNAARGEGYPRRDASRANGPEPSLIVATTYYTREPDGARRTIEPLPGAIAVLQTETAPNAFPALPVRADESVLVYLTQAGAEPSGGTDELAPYLYRDTEQRRLAPTPPLATALGPVLAAGGDEQRRPIASGQQRHLGQVDEQAGEDAGQRHRRGRRLRDARRDLGEQPTAERIAQ